MPNHDTTPEPSGLIAHSPDAHGQAALVLVECLIHGLVERSVLTTVDAIEIVESAKDVQADVAEAADGAGPKMWHSHGLLSAMSTSLQYDIG
jgi:hypothetical protein